MRDGFVAYFLMMLLRRLPMLLLALGAIILALVRWKVSPRVSLMTVSAFIIYLVDMVVFTAFIYWFPQLTESWHLPSSAWIDGIIFFVEDFATAAMIILLTAAAFSSRSQNPNPTPKAS